MLQQIRNAFAAVRTTTFPLVTCILIGVLVVVFAAECLLGLDPRSKTLGPTLYTLVLMGGSSWVFTVGLQQWYRVFSAPFLHLDAAHLLLNCFMLYLAAAPLERVLSRARIWIVYMISGVAGAITSLAINPPNALTIGASGAIAGLLSAG